MHHPLSMPSLLLSALRCFPINFSAEGYVKGRLQTEGLPDYTLLVRPSTALLNRKNARCMINDRPVCGGLLRRWEYKYQVLTRCHLLNNRFLWSFSQLASKTLVAISSQVAHDDGCHCAEGYNLVI